MSDRSSENQSMSSWAAFGEELGPEAHEFFSEIQKEEQEKITRLAHMSVSIGLPIYPTATFDLPQNAAGFASVSQKLTASGDWLLAVRLARTNGRVVYRRLGITADAAIEAANSFGSHQQLVASVTPYRVSERSGTLWMRHGEISLELVLGPHYWISKWTPAAEKLLYCRLSPFRMSAQYSTDNVRFRELLYSSMNSAVHHIFGCSIRRVMNLNLSVYAEFHWHQEIGYRFIECSFSKGWTGAY